MGGAIQETLKSIDKNKFIHTDVQEYKERLSTHLQIIKIYKEIKCSFNYLNI